MNSQNFCPDCGQAIQVELINLTEGVALCSVCGKLSRLYDVAEGRMPTAKILQRIPVGCHVEERSDGVSISASLHSVGGLLMALVFGLFWNGIVSIFALSAISGLYKHLIGPLPAWFPVIEQNDPQTLGMTIFLCVFLIPFVTVGAVMIGAIILSAVGKIEVWIGDGQANLRTGVGRVAWKRRFDPTRVHRVYLERTSAQGGQFNKRIIIDTDPTIRFGTMLEDNRREWLQAVLHSLLTAKPGFERQQVLSKLTQISAD